MIRVKADSPDAAFAAALNQVLDSEGNQIPVTDFKFSDPTSDNEAAVTLADIQNGGQKVGGTVHFGKPNDDGTPALANITLSLLDKEDKVVSSIVRSVEVSAGDPVTFNANFNIEGHPDE